MADNKCSCGGTGMTQRETVCIDTHRILDSCRDRDCYEDHKVWLTEYGQDIIERTANVRVRGAEILRACVCVEPVEFSRGFYRVSVRYYIKLAFEACLGRGSTQEFDGVVAAEKSVVLFGSEGNVKIYRSACDNCCRCGDDNDGADCGTNTPEAVVETVDPVVLGARVAEPDVRCCCCCCCTDLPETVTAQVSGALDDRDGRRRLLVSFGMFSVIRIERPSQLLVSAASCAVPEKECRCQDSCEDPCGIFRTMEFPVSEFNPPSLRNFENCK